MMDEINIYRKNVPSFLLFIESRKHRPIEDVVAEFSARSGVPILALYHFLGETSGFSENIIENIKRIKRFYNLGD